MTTEEKMQMMEALVKGGASIGQLIIENSGTITYHDNRGCGEQQKKEEPKVDLTPELLSKAIMGVQDMFWGNSSYAVLFCVCRDCYSYPDNRTQFERMVELLPHREMFSRSCTPGVISSTFSDNPYMNYHIDNWKKNGAHERVLKLVESFKNAVEEASIGQTSPE